MALEVRGHTFINS